MSESLPERLRQRARFARNLGHPHAPLDEEAADELEALERMVKEQMTFVEDAIRLTAENEALRELVHQAVELLDSSNWPVARRLLRGCVDGGDDE